MDEGYSAGNRWRRWLRTNQGAGALLLILLVGLLIYLLVSDWVYIRLRDGFYLGFFPIASVIFMIICALGIIVDRHRRESTKEMSEIDWRTGLYPTLAVAIFYMYFWAMLSVGFVITAPFLLAPMIYLLGARPWKTAVVASVIITISVYAVFRIIGTNIPQGPLPI